MLTVEFTVLGMPFVGLNGGPQFNFDEAISFQVYTDDQAETDRYWHAIVDDGGSENACGWCKDRFGLSWQIVPRALMDALRSADRAAGKRAMDVMMHAPGGRFVTYDVVRAAGELLFPVPWARNKSASLLISAEETQAALEASGFTIASWTDETAIAIEWFTNAASAPGVSALQVRGCRRKGWRTGRVR